MDVKNAGEIDGIPVATGERVEDEYTISYDWGDVSEIQFSIVWPGHAESFNIQVN
jgi:hypothetical protein